MCSKTNTSQIHFLHYKFTVKQFFLAILFALFISVAAFRLAVPLFVAVVVLEDPPLWKRQD